MTIHYERPGLTLHHGDALDVLRAMDDRSVDCVVTSPPYFGLRDYGVKGQMGAESSPAEYVEHLVAVFREVRRVLADDGTCWLVLGDSYSTRVVVKKSSHQKGLGHESDDLDLSWVDQRKQGRTRMPADYGRPEKNLLGMPWRVALGLQDDGWTLRNAIVWAKSNGMPASVTDRLSLKYEHVFLLVKSKRYHFDLDAIRQPHTTERPPADVPRGSQAWSANAAPTTPQQAHRGGMGRNEHGKNPGDVWTFSTSPFPGAHFATFPPKLVARCVTAGCVPSRCKTCGHIPGKIAGDRELDMNRTQARRAHELATAGGLTAEHFAAIRSMGITDVGKAAVTQTGTGKNTAAVQALAAEAKAVLGGYWREYLLAKPSNAGTSDCGHQNYRPGIVLDPFSGSGTTGMVAAELGRDYVGIDLSAEYLDLSLATRLAIK